MKNFIKFSVLVFCLSLGWTAKGQFTLLHTIDKYAEPNGAGEVMPEIPDLWYLIENKNEIYETIESLTILNPDFSVKKQVVMHVPDNHIVMYSDSYLASAKIWSNDDKVHFFATLRDTVTKKYKMILYNEDGTAVYTFIAATSNPYVYLFEVGEKKYLREELKNYDPETNILSHVTNIYSIATQTNAAPQQKKSASHRPYPNPTQQEITLPYILKSGKVADLIIYNIQGQEVERKRVSGDFDKIRLNVSRYRSGTYIYDCDGVKSKFVVRH